MPALPRRVAALVVALGAAGGVAAGATAAQAQTTTAVPVRPFSFGVSGGLTLPVGDAGDVLNSGFTVQALGLVSTPELPVRLRGEVGYTRFGVEGDNGNLRLFNGTANLVVPFASAPSSIFNPYLIGGVGVYNAKFSEGGDGETKVGLNIGAGADLPLAGIAAFGEVRFVSVRTEGTAINYFPITVGFKF